MKGQGTDCLRGRVRFALALKCQTNPSAYISKISHLLASKPEAVSVSSGVWVWEEQPGTIKQHSPRKARHPAGLLQPL